MKYDSTMSFGELKEALARLEQQGCDEHTPVMLLLNGEGNLITTPIAEVKRYASMHHPTEIWLCEA